MAAGWTVCGSGWSVEELVSGVGQGEVAFVVANAAGGSDVGAGGDAGNVGAAEEQQAQAAGVVEDVGF